MIVKQRWVRKKRWCLLVSSFLMLIVMFFCIFLNDFVMAGWFHYPFPEKCVLSTATNLLNDQCNNFTKGFAFGLLCEALCLSKKITIKTCIHHGNTYVFMAKHNGNNIIIKKKKPRDVRYLYNYFTDFIRVNQNTSSVEKTFFKIILEEIQSSFGTVSSKLLASDFDFFLNTLFGKISLSLKEMQSAILSIAQSELVMFALHRNLKSFPKILGTCGEFYAVDSFQTYSEIYPRLLKDMSWLKRAKIASSFLNLIQDFQNSQVGLLSHCDIQENNFGLTRYLNVKAIDVDLVFSKDKIEEILTQPSCQSDYECNFFDCQSECDTKNGRCTTKSVTNNLQVLCRDILYPKWPFVGLLSSKIPIKIRTQLKQILTHCRSESFGKFSNTHLQVGESGEKLDT
ncbi:divergent protein kinase domain 1C isoform X3 [Hydra vulgaris]|uniref:divergent protein kinase domain 1C isoform X3 n=1 Tax=Hydra vulgaris TaxID=6087 RepID=UPI0032E9E5D5